MTASIATTSALDRNSALRVILMWEGKVSRARVMELFHVSPTRASEWIREFRERHPSSLAWNSKSRAFEATHHAYRAGSDATRSQSLQQYLAITRGLEGVGVDHQVAVRAFRDFVAPAPRVFATLRQAIVGVRQVSVSYRSLREPEPHSHLLEPHALVLAGPRWHLRAFSCDRGDFRDFALGRIVECRPHDRRSDHLWEQDTAWNTTVPVRLMAHPDLTVGQEDVVRHEYFGGAVERVESSRGALVPYLLHEMRVAIDPAQQRPPDFLLAVRNAKEVRPWIFPT